MTSQPGRPRQGQGRHGRLTGVVRVADVVSSDLALVLGQPPRLRVRAWDGSQAGPAGAPVLVLGSRRALRRLVWEPNDLGFGRAYVAGEVDVEGDVFELMHAVSTAAGTMPKRLSTRDRLRLVGDAVRLGAVGRPPAPPPEEVPPLSGELHSADRDRAAVSSHYDVGNDFYRFVLGPSMVYSCAYWPERPDATLEDAQVDKLELVCSKLGLRPGQRLLDVGCGWGSLLVHAALHRGVRAVGVTVSAEQQRWACEQARRAGVGDRVEVRLQDYRDVADGPFDAIASVGMAEHVGPERYRDYASQLFALLRPGGRLLNHQISRRPEQRDLGRVAPSDPTRTFLQAFVFPDGELMPLSTTLGLLEQAGFEVRDVQSLREHYGRTLRSWVGNLERHWPQAVQSTSPGRARVWRLYMVASAVAFELGRLGVDQVLAVRQHADGRSDLPLRRESLLLEGT